MRYLKYNDKVIMHRNRIQENLIFVREKLTMHPREIKATIYPPDKRRWHRGR